MKTLLKVVLSVVGLVLFLGLAAYAVGATMPVDHSVSITGTVSAPPAKVFALITNIAAGPTWRKEVKSVEVLPKNNSRDAWIEDLGSNGKMQFLALTTVPPGPNGHAVRKVETKEPSYGGSWTYDLTPGPDANTTILKITEIGYINPPFYRFLTAYVFGPAKNLKDYMGELQAAAPKA
jgi:hypothetical protein